MAVMASTLPRDWKYRRARRHWWVLHTERTLTDSIALLTKALAVAECRLLRYCLFRTVGWNAGRVAPAGSLLLSIKFSNRVRF